MTHHLQISLANSVKGMNILITFLEKLDTQECVRLAKGVAVVQGESGSFRMG